ncbi:phosphatase PAP2 family protein [Persicimonas caeni]|nr:phosphatase PAP2 family protein [Persicimonas caeni]
MSSIERFSACVVVVVCLLFSHPTVASAQDFEDPRGRPAGSVWSPSWEQPDWFDAALTGGLFAGGAAIQFGLGAPTRPRWIGPVLADGFMRDSLLATSANGLSLAGGASDILLYSLIASPLLVQPGLAWMGLGDANAAANLALINAQALGVTFFSTVALKHTIGRQRPPIGACWDDPNASPTCKERDTLSFPSGHTSMAFAGAGLVCLNHEVLSPLGGGWDRAACYTALSAATATGVLRMVANKHYLTDVVAGAALGLTAGYLLPKWLYFGFGDAEDGVLGEHDASVTPSVGEVNGVNFSFTW